MGFQSIKNLSVTYANEFEFAKENGFEKTLDHKFITTSELGTQMGTSIFEI
jgi:hypothetical protein